MKYLMPLVVCALTGIAVVVVMGTNRGWSEKAPIWTVVLVISLLVGGLIVSVVWRASERKE